MTNVDIITLDKIVNLCKRRGFFYASADIYGGMNGFYDKGHLAVLLSRNLQKLWLWHMYKAPYQMIELDGSIIGSEQVWKASGHVEGFHDPLVDCKSCNVRFRADDVNLEKSCLRCGIRHWSEVRQFNMMFKTNIGAAADKETVGYLRPETAQTIFVQFKNIMSTYRMKIPFGVMQIGKAFRNEITPRQFLFRTREFTQMEMEFFCKKKEADGLFLYWKDRRKEFYKICGFSEDAIRFNDHKAEDLSHYSSATTDVEYLFPFGWKELEGIAYRTDFDLAQHKKASGKDLSLYDEKKEESYIPNVIECSVGLERLMFAFLCSAYHEEMIKEDVRVALRLPAFLAPITCAVFPMSEFEEKYATKVYDELKVLFSANYDSAGSIGKRYRRFDEIGTPWCITIDAQTISDNTMTIRNRDTMEQQRLTLEEIMVIIQKSMQY